MELPKPESSVLDLGCWSHPGVFLVGLMYTEISLLSLEILDDVQSHWLWEAEERIWGWGLLGMMSFGREGRRSCV